MFSVGLEAAQRRDHFVREKFDRPHQIFFGDSADIEFTEHGVEQACAGGFFDLFDDRLRRADKGQITFTEIFHVNRVTSDLRALLITSFEVVLRKPLVADAALGARAENIGEAVFEAGLPALATALASVSST